MGCLGQGDQHSCLTAAAPAAEPLNPELRKSLSLKRYVTTPTSV
jgi:hypothetical protein